MSSLVSIIVPCYKQAHFLKDSLQSVLDQNYSAWECLIVNDGSPDNVSEIAQQWINKDSRFKYLEKQNGGLSSARNFGIKNSKGSYILPLDADDILHQDYLKKTVFEIEQNESIAIVSSYSRFFIKEKQNIVYELKPKGNSCVDLLYVNQLVATSLYRKEYWEEVGGYDESMKKGFEDWEFWIAITKKGLKYKIIEEFLFYYRKSKKSMLVDTISNHAIKVKEYIFKKHQECYIADFENCMTVLFYEQDAIRKNQKRIKNSLEYKIAKIICKPYRIVQKLWGKK
ncbi:glycosyltransferase family 2 protein [Flavobacterium panacagri]|uniref:glycosyltransferase family 2 protein n=1 Tax=Flavobacterium panacagri TaxID=3034146 RepID=UPI0025A5A8DC|nr:glycosyltransferase family A protein [Flavobacterium panacagri]